MKEAITLSEEDFAKIRNAATIIESNLKYHHRIEDLAEKVWINKNKLKTGFKQEFGTGPYGYLMNKRMERSKELLLDSRNESLTSIAIAMGFTGHYAETNFIKFFKKFTGHAPIEWKRLQLKLQNEQSKKRISA